jgi:hypothetical protein
VYTEIILRLEEVVHGIDGQEDFGIDGQEDFGIER